MCLKNMIQSNLALNFSDIFEKISPIIISLFNQFNSADTIWNLIQLFILFLQNLQDKAVDYLETIIRSTNLDKLLETDQEILIQIMHDMLRHLIVAFPVNSSIPYIYSACLKFIAIQMKKRKYSQETLKLWYLIIKEYNQIQNLDSQMLQLLYDNLPLISKETEDAGIMSLSLYIIEEYLLIDFIAYDQYLGICSVVINYYKIANQMKLSEDLEQDAIQVKIACMNIISTIQLILMNKGQTKEAFTIFQEILSLSISDLMGSNKQLQG